MPRKRTDAPKREITAAPVYCAFCYHAGRRRDLYDVHLPEPDGRPSPLVALRLCGGCAAKLRKALKGIS